MPNKEAKEKILTDVAFIIERETPEDVAAKDVANVISDVQHYLKQILTAREGEEDKEIAIRKIEEYKKWVRGTKQAITMIDSVCDRIIRWLNRPTPPEEK